MIALSHSLARLSISALAAFGALALPSAAQAAVSPYYGRWTVSDDNPVFSARGRPYRTVDVAPCGKDFCGVSVGDNGQCGATLFRFLTRHAAGEDDLRGHGRWGNAKKNLLIYTYENEGARTLELYLGDGYDFGERSDNMPKFHANYRRASEATCRTS
jgi:hypothetical protein